MLSTCLFIFGITSVDTHYTLSHLGIHVDVILVLAVVEGIVSIRDALTATVRYYFCIRSDYELRCLFCGHYSVVRFESLFNCS